MLSCVSATLLMSNLDLSANAFLTPLLNDRMNYPAVKTDELF